jgi:hypothetical protein
MLQECGNSSFKNGTRNGRMIMDADLGKIRGQAFMACVVLQDICLKRLEKTTYTSLWEQFIQIGMCPGPAEY